MTNIVTEFDGRTVDEALTYFRLVSEQVVTDMIDGEFERSVA